MRSSWIATSVRCSVPAELYARPLASATVTELPDVTLCGAVSSFPLAISRELTVAVFGVPSHVGVTVTASTLRGTVAAHGFV